MRHRGRRQDIFPAPLQKFVPEEWPQLSGECLGIFGCHGEGYGVDCCPRPGEWCGQLYYEAMARDHPDRPDMLARAKAADSYIRWHQARLSWVEGDDIAWMDEFLSSREHEIRYGKRRNEA